jgi:glycosyl-4,4'-diaponeurosporenoate acyltransferase
MTLVLLNTGTWLAIHVAVVWAVTQLRAERFRLQGWLFRERGFEEGGEVYDRLFAVRRWKRLLPDGARLAKGGFRKKRLSSAKPEYLHRFALETCRGELAHWIPAAVSPLFFLWNPPWAGLLNVVLAVLLHLPFIMVQRHNRFRLGREIASRQRQPALPVAPLEVLS